MESNDRVQRIGDIMQRNMRQIKVRTLFVSLLSALAWIKSISAINLTTTPTS